MRNDLIRSTLMTSVILISTASAALADGKWQSSTVPFEGSLRAGSREKPVQPGDETVVQISNGKPGAEITVLHGADLLTAEPTKLDEKGAAKIAIKVPADAELGHHQLVVISQNPTGAAVVPLKLSSVVDLSNKDKFEVTKAEIGERAYQSALSADGKLYVSTARGPNEESRLLRLDADTLEFEAEAELPKSAAEKDGLIDVFGIAVDNAGGKVWTTNTLNETVTVYDTETLKPVKVFEEGSVQHPREVVIDEKAKRAYVSAALSGNVEVYDTEKLEHIETISFEANRGRDLFGTMALVLDAEGEKLYSVSRDTPYVGWIDLASGESTTVKVPAISGGSGLARDPETGRLFVASQETNNVVVLDKDGKVLSDTYVGAGAVSVVWDPATGHAYAATRAGGTIAVLDADGKLVANLAADETPNHLTLGPKGVIYAIAMYGTKGDNDQSGSVARISPIN